MFRITSVKWKVKLSWYIFWNWKTSFKWFRNIQSTCFQSKKDSWFNNNQSINIFYHSFIFHSSRQIFRRKYLLCNDALIKKYSYNNKSKNCMQKTYLSSFLQRNSSFDIFRFLFQYQSSVICNDQLLVTNHTRALYSNFSIIIPKNNWDSYSSFIRVFMAMTLCFW